MVGRGELPREGYFERSIHEAQGQQKGASSIEIAAMKMTSDKVESFAFGVTSGGKSLVVFQEKPGFFNTIVGMLRKIFMTSDPEKVSAHLKKLKGKAEQVLGQITEESNRELGAKTDAEKGPINSAIASGDVDAPCLAGLPATKDLARLNKLNRVVENFFNKNPQYREAQSPTQIPRPFHRSED